LISSTSVGPFRSHAAKSTSFQGSVDNEFHTASSHDPSVVQGVFEAALKWSRCSTDVVRGILGGAWLRLP
jgi:hypothetical protein